MKLNRAHVCNLGIVSDIVEEMFLDMCQPSEVMKNTIERFNYYNSSLCFKATCTLNYIKIDFGYLKKEFLKLKAKIFQSF